MSICCYSYLSWRLSTLFIPYVLMTGRGWQVFSFFLLCTYASFLWCLGLTGLHSVFALCYYFCVVFMYVVMDKLHS